MPDGSKLLGRPPLADHGMNNLTVVPYKISRPVVIQHENVVTCTQQRVRQMRTDEPQPARH
jgi:hypothetical protein